MQYQGVLTKMQTEFGETIQYFLVFESDFIHVNQLLNKTLNIQFIKQQCLNCKNDRNIYRQGFCKNCFFDIPQAADWIMKPELSKAHLDIEDRDLEYEKSVQLKPHIVYLANSSNIKVGVTRKSQVPTRWIDQGANNAIAIVETPNRYLAGITEVALKQHVADKTNWREMLKNTSKNEDLLAFRDSLKSSIPAEAQPYFIASNMPTEINFPVHQYPEKPKSLNIIKSQSYTGKLVGIKGQYLIFDDDTVFNIRSNEGNVVSLNIG